MLIGVPKEIKNHEYRVGLIPSSVRELIHHGHKVLVETKAGAGIGLSTTSVTSAASTATSEPPPIATPRSAAARAGESLIPSPTIATRRPRARSSSTMLALSAGRTPPRARSAGSPIAAATVAVVASWSPEMSHVSTPARARSATAS